MQTIKMTTLARGEINADEGALLVVGRDLSKKAAKDLIDGGFAVEVDPEVAAKIAATRMSAADDDDEWEAEPPPETASIEGPEKAVHERGHPRRERKRKGT